MTRRCTPTTKMTNADPAPPRKGRGERVRGKPGTAAATRREAPSVSPGHRGGRS
jgi:hypothetical protein